jgi:hypothetical protein
MSNDATKSCGHPETDAYKMAAPANSDLVGVRWGCKRCDAAVEERRTRPSVSLSQKLMLAKKARDHSGVVLDRDGFEVSQDPRPSTGADRRP